MDEKNFEFNSLSIKKQYFLPKKVSVTLTDLVVYITVTYTKTQYFCF